MKFHLDPSIAWTTLPVLLRGAVVTVELTLICLVIGMTLGLAVALARIGRNQLLRVISGAFVELFRNVPPLIQLIWFFYALPILVGLQISPFSATVLGIALNTAAYCSEIYRAGFGTLSKGQWEASRAIGMKEHHILIRIILPQVYSTMLPAFTNRLIEVVKITSLASILSVHDLMHQARLLSSTYYRPVEILTTVGLVYFAIIYPMSFASARFERRMARSR